MKVDVSVPKFLEVGKYLTEAIVDNGFKIVPKYRGILMKTLVKKWIEATLADDDFMDQIVMDLIEGEYILELKEKGWVVGEFKGAQIF